VEPHPTIQYSSLFLFFNDNTSVLYWQLQSEQSLHWEHLYNK
jgi:hypothetical protein